MNRMQRLFECLLMRDMAGHQESDRVSDLHGSFVTLMSGSSTILARASAASRTLKFRTFGQEHGLHIEDGMVGQQLNVPQPPHISQT